MGCPCLPSSSWQIEQLCRQLFRVQNSEAGPLIRYTTLTALDFLGFGLPPDSPSLGELVGQGRDNLQAPWLGLTVFVVLATLLSLLVFIGDAVRDAFDPRT